MSIRVLLIDDEESGINALKMLLQRYIPEVTEIYTAIGPQEGSRKIKSLHPDLVFLDVEMPLQSGFDLLATFPHHAFEVIFVTAYDHYAIKAIRFSALDYLLKPVDAQELKQAVERYDHKRKSTKGENPLLHNFLENIKSSPADYRLAINTTAGTHFLQPADIIRCEADGNYTLFYLESRKKIMASRTLKEYDEILTDHDFIRVHKSHLVNRKYIQSFSSDHLILKDNTVVEVSRRRSAAIKARLLL
jgi:two-component system LytT family response regulator